MFDALPWHGRFEWRLNDADADDPDRPDRAGSV